MYGRVVLKVRVRICGRSTIGTLNLVREQDEGQETKQEQQRMMLKVAQTT